MSRPITIVLVASLIAAVPGVGRAQSSGSDIGKNAATAFFEPWLPQTLAITFHTELAGCSVYCIAKRNCKPGSRFVLIALSYGISTLDALVGTLLLTRDVDDPAMKHEDRVYGYTALGLAALNLGLGLWNHLSPQRPQEKKLKLAPIMLHDSSGGAGPGVLLTRRF